jgi:hypothetical protein
MLETGIKAGDGVKTVMTVADPQFLDPLDQEVIEFYHLLYKYSISPSPIRYPLRDRDDAILLKVRTVCIPPLPLHYL